MDWIIAIAAGWVLRGLGTQRVEAPNVFKGTAIVPEPVAKVPPADVCLSQLAGIDERIARMGTKDADTDAAVKKLWLALRGGRDE